MRPIPWQDYFIGIRPQHNTLYIGKRRFDQKTKKEKYPSTSGNRTDEIIRRVIDKFSMDVKRNGDPNKPYAGVTLQGVGTLVFIKEGFDFSVKPSPRKRSKS